MSTSGSVKFVWMSLNRPTRSICLPQVDKTPEIVSQTIWLILGRTCLVPSPHSTRSMRFESLGLSEVVRRFQRVRLGDATSTFSITHLIAPLPPPPKKNSIGIVFNCNTQEKWKTKVMQNFRGSNKVHSSGKCGSGVYVKCIDREGWGNAVQGLGKGRSGGGVKSEQFHYLILNPTYFWSLSLSTNSTGVTIQIKPP